MYYVTKGDKVFFWGKLSECVTFIGDCFPVQAGCNIVYKDSLTKEQTEWLHKIKKTILSLHQST